MEKSAILALGYDGVDINGYYKNLNQDNIHVMLHADNPYLKDMIGYGDKIIVVLRNSDISRISELTAMLKEKGFTISLDVLICSFIEGLANVINSSIDTKANEPVDVFGSFTSFIEKFQELNLASFKDVSIVDGNWERYSPESDMTKAVEYLNLVFNNNDAPGIEEKIRVVIDKFTNYIKTTPDNNLYKLYDEVSKLLDHADKKDISLE